MPGYSARTSLYVAVLEAARQQVSRNTNAAVRAAADDIANDVVLTLARKQHQQPGFIPDNPAAWATAATKNRIIDYVRRLERDAGNAHPDDDEAGRLQGALPLDDAVVTGLRAVATERASVGGMNRALLSQAVDQLGWNSREYLLMALVAEGVSYADIADQMGYRSADVVKTMVARLRREAKAVLGEARDWLATPGPGAADGGHGRGRPPVA